MPKSRRTTHRSSKGKKLYAVRKPKGKPGGGRFKDIQSYKKAHGSDIKRRSKAELAKKAQERLARTFVEDCNRA